MAVGQRLIHPFIEGLGSQTFQQGWFPMWDVAQQEFVGRGVPNQVTVGNSGGDFTSVKAACDYVATQSPSTSSLWRILVYPGVYTEAAFTVPDYTTLCGPYAIGSTGRTYHDSRAPQIINNASVTSGAFVTLGNSSALEGMNILFTVNSPTGDFYAVQNPVSGTVHQADIAFCIISVSGDASAYASAILKADSKTLCGRNTFQQACNPATNAIGCWADTKEIGLFYSVLIYTGVDSNGGLVAFRHSNSNTSGLIFSRLFNETGYAWQTCIAATAGSVYVADTPHPTSSGSQYITQFDTKFTTKGGARQAGTISDTPLTLDPFSVSQTGHLMDWHGTTGSGFIAASGSMSVPGLQLPSGAANGYLWTSDPGGFGSWAAPPVIPSVYWTQSSGSLYPSTSSDLAWLTGGLKSPYTRTVIVDIGGKGDFTSVKAACDYVSTQSPSISNTWLVELKPGNYVEAPFTIPTYTTVRGDQTYPMSEQTQNTMITANANLTSGAFITATSRATLANLGIRANCDSAASAECQIFSGNGPRVYNCFFFGTQSSASQTFVGIKSAAGGAWIFNSVIFISGANVRIVWAPGGNTFVFDTWLRGTPAYYYYDEVGNSNLVRCSMGNIANGPVATTADIYVGAGILWIDHTTYRTTAGAGTITHVDRWYTSTSGIHEAATAASIPLTTKEAATPTATLAFQHLNSSNALQFGLGTSGSLLTNQISSGSGLGTVVNKMPIYNTSGSLMGYLPLYGSIS